MTKEIPQIVIVTFQDSVSKDQIDQYVADVIKNGGVIKDRYYESPGSILNGFSASIDYYGTFSTFRADEVKSIESDQIVTTQ